MFAVSDILISFGIYFCSWHSVRGLARLAREHRKTPYELALVAAPLSFGAISLAALGMWIWSSGQPLPEALSRTLFVALSALAVPHLLLHGPITHVGIRSDRGTRRTIATMEPV
jgi:Brp/Blh family beta-carotene 15,15'-monooxygenase